MDILNQISNKYIEIVNELFNGKKYRYLSALLLVSIFLIIYIILYKINPFKISNNYSEIILLLVTSLIISSFYFFVYRNTYRIKNLNIEESNGYSEENNKFYSIDKGAKKELYFERMKINKYFLNPLFKIFQSIGLLLFIIILTAGIISSLFFLINNYNSLFIITKIILLIFIILHILTLIAYFVKINIKDYNKELKDIGNGKSKLNMIQIIFLIIKYFIFILPCLLLIFFEYINKEIKGTPSAINMLLISELILICLIFFLPVIFEYINTFNKHDLLKGKGPYYLSEYREIGKYQEFSNTSLDSLTSNKYIKKFKDEINKDINEIKNDFNQMKKDVINIFNKDEDINGGQNSITKNISKYHYNYTYSISLYLYLNPQSNNKNLAYNSDCELFNYGNKPVILYNGNNRELIIKSQVLTLKDNNFEMQTIYITKNFKYQKWLFIVINYDNNIIDIFIDGDLVGSLNNVPPYFTDDKVTIGQNNGIEGSIKDIYYYTNPIVPSNIKFLYNLKNN